MKKKPEIKFVSIVRDCPFNLTAKAQGKRPIMDFQVLIDGDMRVQWKSNHHRRGYELVIHAGEFYQAIKEIPEHGRREEVVRAETKSQFSPLIERLLAEGKIPTLYEIEMMIQAKAAEADRVARAAVAEQAAEAQRQRFEEHGAAMLHALEEIATHLPNILRAFETLKIVAREEDKSHLAHEIKACRTYRKLIEDVIPKVKGQ